MSSPLEILRAHPAWYNAALVLAWELKSQELAAGALPMRRLIQLADVIDDAQTEGKALVAQTDAALRVLKSASPAPSSALPIGF
ncbi:MAG TPA: hypothetical protein VF914_17635 [Chloroflexia bacterium]|jgi:hypothetical protein